MTFQYSRITFDYFSALVLSRHFFEIRSEARSGTYLPIRRVRDAAFPSAGYPGRSGCVSLALQLGARY